MPPAVLGLDNVLAVVPGAGGGVGKAADGGAQLAVAAAGRAAALLLAREPRLDTTALKRRLIETGGDPTWRPHK